MTKPFWEFTRSGDTAEHRARGVGPASDYETPMHTPLLAPFAGRVESFHTTEGGYGARLYGDKYTCVVQHLVRRPENKRVGHRDVFATSGNTGSKTSGPHVHAYIIVHATGKRISMYEWLRDYVNKPAPTAVKPVVKGLTGRTIDLTASFYWYQNAANAERTYRPKGGKYGGGIMLSGKYTILGVSRKGALKVRSNANGIVYLHPSVVKNRHARIK